MFDSLLKVISLGRVFAVLLILAFFALISTDVEAESKKSVLVLHSYHKGLSWTDSITAGILKRFQEEKVDVDISYEFMDSKRYTGIEHYGNLERLYFYKYQHSSPDIIISSDDNAFLFLLKKGRQIFQDTPVVFCGVNNFQPIQIKGLNNFTGVEEDFDFKATIEAALSLQDGIKKIVVLSDNTTTGWANTSRLMAIIPDFNDKVLFEFLNNYSMEDVQKYVAGLGNNAIVFWLHFTQDRNGKFFSFEESSELVSQASSVPLYSSWDFHMNHGIVGGMITSGVQQGYTAAGLAVRILAGETPSAIPIISDSPNQYMFDYVQLKRYGIDLKRLPLSSVVINQPESFYQKNKRLIFLICGGFVLLVCIILLLAISNFRRQKAEAHATAAKNRYLGIFNDTSVALLVEDFSALVADFREILKQAPKDIRQHLLDNPKLTTSLARKMRVKDANPAALQLYGIAEKADLNGIIQRIVGQGKRNELVDFLAALLEGRGRYVVETVNTTLSGGKINIILEVKFPENYAEYGSILVSIVDITQRKRAEDALLVSETRFRAAFDSAGTGMALLSLSGEYQQVNQALLATLGYRENELIGKNWQEFTHPEDIEKSSESLRRLFSGEMCVPFEKRYFNKYGETVWVLYCGALIYDSEHQPVNIISQFQDISQRKEAEAKLIEQTAQYRKFFEDDLAGVFVCNSTGKLVNYNLAFQEMFGLEGSMIPKNIAFSEFFPNDSDWHKFFNSLLLKTKLEYYELHLINAAGTPLDVIINAIGRFNRSGKLREIQGYIMDVSRQKNLELQLLQAQKLESVGTMAGGVAHDFNNLLMGIMGNVSLLLLEKDSSHPDYSRLKNIEEYAWSGSSLTRQLLGFAKGGKYEVKTCDINELIRANADLFSQTHKEIEIIVELNAELTSVDIDKSQIDQVMYNLYVNAWQAMTDGGVIHVRTKDTRLSEEFVEPYEMPAGEYVGIEVEDNGSGMDAETLRRIFDPFFTTKEISRGTGLGLASSYGIIQNHSGIIMAESEPESGSCFYIYLPVSQHTPEPVAESVTNEDIIPGKEKILLVDDEDMIIKVGSQMLEALGYEVIGAESGSKALAIFKDAHAEIDLVILDMVMPTLGGGDTFDGLKEIEPDVNVILSSGYSLDAKAQSILERGCRAFMQKPFDLQTLSEKVHHALEPIGQK